ncbi:MAG: hypothetical protein KC546_03405, partial [Anaerolineae bacterium]|nr:hypothetical protein [Anaerolineae bacterium]
MDTSFEIYYLIIFIAISAVAVLAVQVWSRRPGKGVLAFVVLSFALIEWATMSVLELYSTDLSAKYFFAQLSYIGIVLVPGAWL